LTAGGAQDYYSCRRRRRRHHHRWPPLPAVGEHAAENPTMDQNKQPEFRLKFVPSIYQDMLAFESECLSGELVLFSSLHQY
jgi:hypothetical protein